MTKILGTNRHPIHGWVGGCLFICTATLFPIIFAAAVLAEPMRDIRHFELSAAGINRLVVNCGAGALDVTGVHGLDKIQVVAEVEVEGIQEEEFAKFIESNVRLDLKKWQSRAVLNSDISAPPSCEARINLSIAVPRNVAVKITDGSGPIRVGRHNGDVTIDDDSGKIQIDEITGSVTVNDGSGEIVIEGVVGNIMVRDGSGSIAIDQVTGDVYVTDGSGDISILHIDGNVTVSDDSGDIDISDVSGNVDIREAVSGEITIERVRGKITTRE